MHLYTKHSVFAPLLLSALALPCLAQVPVQKSTSRPAVLASQAQPPSPRNVLAAFPANPRLSRVAAPTQAHAPAPNISRMQIDQAQSRKLQAIAAWGMAVPASALRPSYWLSPQVPHNADNGASFQIATRERYTAHYGEHARFPSGYIEVFGRNDSDAKYVFGDVPASPKLWLLLECPADGSRSYTVTHWMRAAPGTRGQPVAVARTGLVTGAQRDGRVRTLIEPTLSPRIDIQFHGVDSPEGPWQFGGCEITPFEA